MAAHMHILVYGLNVKFKWQGVNAERNPQTTDALRTDFDYVMNHNI